MIGIIAKSILISCNDVELLDVAYDICPQDSWTVMGPFSPIAGIMLPARISCKGLRYAEVLILVLRHHTELYSIVLPPVIGLPT